MSISPRISLLWRLFEISVKSYRLTLDAPLALSNINILSIIILDIIVQEILLRRFLSVVLLKGVVLVSCSEPVSKDVADTPTHRTTGITAQCQAANISIPGQPGPVTTRRWQFFRFSAEFKAAAPVVVAGLVRLFITAERRPGQWPQIRHNILRELFIHPLK